MASRFYLNYSLRPGPLELEGSEAHHLTNVKRLYPGDQVYLFNGDGLEYPALIDVVQRRLVRLNVQEGIKVDRELSFDLMVAAPLPKGDRAQFLLEKLTELGVTRFIPLKTKRSVIVPRDAKMEKLQRWVIEASKQCGRNVLMEVDELAEWEPFCQQQRRHMKLIAHPGGESLGDVNLEQMHETGAVVAVGPEGGFTEEEVELATTSGWQIVHLGPRILRIETAAIALAARITGS